MISITVTVDDFMTKKQRSITLKDDNYNSDINQDDLLDLIKDTVQGLGYNLHEENEE